ncbi:MAG: MotA/TolQ/ExbB proton channel family protein [Candidatus Cloacimonetes bacterium]|nr:MotA/TolQ/ExbB proton channel family protein [Candidatus Cloacimonadota bacterium]
MLNTILVVAAEPTQINFFSMATKGGFLMLVLLLISIIAVAIIVDRILTIKRSKVDDENFVRTINDFLKSGEIKKAVAASKVQENCLIANVINKALEHFNGNIAEVKEVIESAVKQEVHFLEKYLGSLATFAATAPLIGFLGTVTGMVKVFMKIGETGGGVDINLLAGGIWEALITTIGGLSVGIITILFYNFLVGKIEVLAQDLENDTNEFLFALRRMKNES